MGRKNGKHGAVSEKSNIAAVSYMVVQLYELILHTVQSGKMDFRDRPDRLSLLQVKEYALLTSLQFLTLLSQKPTSNPTGLYLSECFDFIIEQTISCAEKSGGRIQKTKYKEIIVLSW